MATIFGIEVLVVAITVRTDPRSALAMNGAQAKPETFRSRSDTVVGL